MSKHFVVDGPPAVVLKSHVPTVMVIVLRLVVVNVNSLLASVLLHGHVIARSKRVDVNNTAVGEDLVVNERWEFSTAETEPNVALRSSV